MRLINILKIYAIGTDWAITNPFGIPLGIKKGFLIADSTYTDAEFESLPKYLFKLGELSNTLDFLEKTRSTKNYNTIGIGGFAKLKDYDFQILNTGVTNHIDLYGKKITVERKIDDLALKKDFEGKIQTIIKVEEFLEISCEANISLSNEIILSNDTVNDGTVSFINTPNNGYIKLLKDNTNEFRLIFNSYLYYKIQGIYLNNGDSGVMYELKNTWKQEGKYIYLSTNKSSILQRNMGVGNSYNIITDTALASTLFDTVQFNNNGLVDFTFVDIDLLQYVTEAKYVFAIPGSGNLYYTFKPVDQLNGITKTFECPWFQMDVNGRVYLYDLIGLSLTLTIKEPDPKPPYEITKKVTMLKIRKEPLVVLDKKILFDDTWDILYKTTFYSDHLIYQMNDTLHELSTLEQVKQGFIRLLSTEQETQPIIQIGNEKMLVLGMTQSYPATQAGITLVDLTGCVFFVMRGYDKTIIATHAIGDTVNVLNDTSTKLLFNLQVPLLGFKRIPRMVGYNSNQLLSYYNNPLDVNRAINLFFKSYSLYNLWKSRECILPMEFDIPDLAADILSIKLVGSGTYRQVGSEGDETQNSSMICVTKSVLGELFEETCVFYGRSSKYSEIYNWLWETYSTTKLSNVQSISLFSQICSAMAVYETGEGDFIHSLDGTWQIRHFHDDDSCEHYRKSLVFDYFTKTTEDDISNFFMMKDFDELKESNLALRYLDLNCFYPFEHPYPSVIDDSYCDTTMHLTLKHVYLDIDAELSLVDNDFYAKVSSDQIQLIQVDSISLGSETRSEIAYIKDANKHFIFISCTNYKLGAFEVIETTGKFTLKDFYNPTEINPTNSYLTTKYPDKSGTIYSYKGTNLWYASDFSITSGVVTLNKTLYETSTISGQAAPTFVTINNFKIVIELVGGVYYLKSYKQQIITNLSNPVTLIKQMLTTYLGFTSDNIDTVAFTTAETAKKDHTCYLYINTDSNLNEVLDKICKEHGLMLFENNIGKVSIIDLRPPSTISITITDSDVIFKDNLPDVKIEYTDLDYLISEMDINYNYFNGKYQGNIKSADLLSLKPMFEKAKKYLNGSKSKAILNLSTVTTKDIAIKCATIKMSYHMQPNRIVEISCIKETALSLGDWILLDVTGISNTNGSSFLIFEVSSNEIGLVKYKLFEFINSIFLSGYQEYPETGDLQLEENPDSELIIQENPNNY